MALPTRPQRVLIVDDEPESRGTLAELFALFGYVVLAAGGAAEALALLEQHPVEVVLTNVRVPTMDGLELVHRIRASRPERPVIMVTSAPADDLPEVLYAAGANGFLTKPFGASGVRDAFLQASVGPARRWAQAPVGGTHLSFSRRVTGADVTLGRGGIFWPIEGPLPSVKQIVDFAIERASGEPWRGRGIVRWTRGPSAERPAGCGIEFLHLDQGCRGQILARIEGERPVAFIPRG